MGKSNPGIALKKLLFNACTEYVQQKIDLANKGMKEAQSAANNETKSSAGDKYETGRAMMQIERDRHARKLSEALELKSRLSLIPIDSIHSEIKTGSIAYTNRGIFFISIGAGKLNINGNKYFAVSEQAPIIRILKPLKIGDSILFNGQELILNDIQ